MDIRKAIANGHLAALVAALGAYAFGCSEDRPRKRNTPTEIKSDTGKDTGKGTGTDTEEEEAAVAPEDPLKDVKPYNDAEAVAFFKAECKECHNTENGSVVAFWAYDEDKFSREVLARDNMAHTVYQTLYTRLRNVEATTPSPMPVEKLTGKRADALARTVKWMQVNVPQAVAQAKTTYGSLGGNAASDQGTGVILNFKCKEPLTFREYMSRVTTDLFNRPPTPAELELGEDGPNAKTTKADREMVAKRLFKEWKNEFYDENPADENYKGLMKFAAKLADVRAIQPVKGPNGVDVISPAQAEDLRQEFYQILRKGFESTSFKDMLLSQKTMVTKNTASLYQCPNPPTDDSWQECAMDAPRGTFFTTMGFLASKPVSFLNLNNNYGRVGLVHFIIRGDVFSAAFNQKTEATTVKDIPSCLQSEDLRGEVSDAGTYAPFGSLAIPETANLCQSCHIARQMAAGSILFRPYSGSGLLYGNLYPLESDPSYNLAANVGAVAGKEKYRVKDFFSGALTKIDGAFLRSLLDNANQGACIPGGGPNGADLQLSSVGDLAKYLIGDNGAILASGLARHLPRALSNLQNTSEEVIVKVNQAFTDGGGKLGPVFEAYISSETYACKSNY